MRNLIRVRRWQAGVTLIELMVSITIGVVILGAILAVFSATSSTGKQSETATRMSEDAAVAMNYMAGYIRMAGYSVPRINAPANTAIVGTATLEVTDSNFSGAGVRGCDMGFTNVSATPTSSLSCKTSGTDTSAISIRFEGDVYNTAPVGTPAINPSDCLNQSVSASTTSSYDSTLYPLIETRFFVKTGTNSGVPELFCAGNGSGTFVPQPIMQYVESLSLTYGVADNGSSRLVTSYLGAAGVDAAMSGVPVDQLWARVVSVKICLVMRSEMPDQNAPGSYINCAGSRVASPDRFLRRAFKSVVTVRNRGGIS